MKVIQKYFLALIPPTEVVERVQKIKNELQETFGLKYALKSPPHLTIKMPFNFNEAKEDQLVASLQEHTNRQDEFRVNIAGVGKFGNRVIFLRVEKSEELIRFQQGVSKFCKTELHLSQELSDRNFHPHMTVAFKDLKASHFSEIFRFVSDRGFDAEFSVGGIALLKRSDGIWNRHNEVPFT